MHDQNTGQEHQAVHGIVFIGCRNAQTYLNCYPEELLMLTIYKNMVDNFAKPVYNRQYRKAGLQ